MALLSRSSCSLATLSIESLTLVGFNLIDLVTHLPSLHNLSTNDSYAPPECNPITDRFIEMLQVRDTGSHRPIVPRLRSLKLNVGASTFNDGLVIDMVSISMNFWPARCMC
ncbi:hypothetical protein BT96DRAFT_314125 [Gymnopus androsaceus JB14]|uniref:F-box domain-containing protein n=1 Tax=Gymnopus androsaceus JB14 TaxID=1447944 RepID=A0A6A4I1N7_9AGAR|nr:hypothetical protein BT96DRAFT_314125 [Gymnopus androsaceus JB14]